MFHQYLGNSVQHSPDVHTRKWEDDDRGAVFVVATQTTREVPVKHWWDLPFLQPIHSPLCPPLERLHNNNHWFSSTTLKWLVLTVSVEVDKYKCYASKLPTTTYSSRWLILINETISFTLYNFYVINKISKKYISQILFSCNVKKHNYCTYIISKLVSRKLCLVWLKPYAQLKTMPCLPLLGAAHKLHNRLLRQKRSIKA